MLVLCCKKRQKIKDPEVSTVESRPEGEYRSSQNRDQNFNSKAAVGKLPGVNIDTSRTWSSLLPHLDTYCNRYQNPVAFIRLFQPEGNSRPRSFNVDNLSVHIIYVGK